MGEIYEHPLPPDKIGDFANLRCEPGFCCGGAVDPNVLLTVPLPLPPNLTCCSKKLHRVAPRLFLPNLNPRRVFRLASQRPIQDAACPDDLHHYPIFC